jgi:hypothetical protein
VAILLGAARSARAQESPLAIIDAGVQDTEDAPFVGPSYRFLPGDTVYFTFQISGFSSRAIGTAGTRTIALSYEITPQDSKGTALAPSVEAKIDAELNPEDKTWLPKRRASFVLPVLLASGECRIHVLVKDAISKTEATKDFSFRTGGPKVEQSASLSVQDFGFFRRPEDREPLDVAAYAPGDEVFTRFTITGFKTDAHKRYHVSYGVLVTRPDGKPFLEQPKASDLSDAPFYPAKFVPGVFSVITASTAPRGQYVVTVSVHDLVGDTNFEVKRAFSIE